MVYTLRFVQRYVDYKLRLYYLFPINSYFESYFTEKINWLVSVWVKLVKCFFLFKMQTYLSTCTSKFLARCVFSLNIECMAFSWISIFLFLSFDWIESLKPSAIVSFTLSSLEIGFGGTYHSVEFVFTRFYEFVNIVNN